MDMPRTEHRAAIHEARNVLGEVIARARFAGEPTILTNRGKEAAVIVNHDFYVQAVQDHEIVEIFRKYDPDLFARLIGPNG